MGEIQPPDLASSKIEPHIYQATEKTVKSVYETDNSLHDLYVRGCKGLANGII